MNVAEFSLGPSSYAAQAAEFAAAASTAPSPEARAYYTARARNALERAKEEVSRLELLVAAQEAEAVRVKGGAP